VSPEAPQERGETVTTCGVSALIAKQATAGLPFPFSSLCHNHRAICGDVRASLAVGRASYLRIRGAVEHSMKKEELEAFLATAKTRPISVRSKNTFMLSRRSRSCPISRSACAWRESKKSAPSLRAVLLRAADGEVLSDDESLLLFRGLHILGGARDREARQPLLRLLRRPFQEVDDLIGDTVIESLANIVTGVFDDDSDRPVRPNHRSLNRWIDP
jgi:hypothetical protein